MGWYDAFKSNVDSTASINKITSNSGSAGKYFGDAFKDFGKSLQDSENQKIKDDVADANIKASQAHTALYTAQNTQAAIDNEFNNNKRKDQAETKKLDDAFKRDFASTSDINYQKSLLEFEKPDGEFDSSVSSSAFEYASKKIASDELSAQKNFNDEAVKVSVDGGYADFSAFKTANADSQLFKNTDGTTMKSIEKYFNDKDSTLKDIKTQQKLLAKDKQISALAGSKKNKGFVYDENTDTKIAAQVKTAMGMDAPNFNFDDTTKVAFQNAVAGSAKISKKYNLEPSLAIHVYQNPDMYDFTADNKVIQKKSPKKAENKDRLNIFKRS